MPLLVTDLKPGDRVVLNCPKARGEAKREARFEGVFNSVDAAMQDGTEAHSVLIQPDTVEFMATRGALWAKFLLQTARADALFTTPGGDPLQLPPAPAGTMQELSALFMVHPDGGLIEETGRRIYIERRVIVGQG